MSMSGDRAAGPSMGPLTGRTMAQAMRAKYQARALALDAAVDKLSRRGARPSLQDIDSTFALSRQVASDLARLQGQHQPALEALLSQIVARSGRVLEAPAPRLRMLHLRAFWMHDWPTLVYARRRAVGFAAAVLAFGAVLGAVLTWIDPQLGQSLVGPEVAQAVSDGKLWTDPIAEQGQHSAAAAFIFTNNIRVSIAAFAGGLVWGLGALLLMFFNGLQLGAVLAYTGLQPDVQRGLLDFISAHGPVELSLVAIAGGAGLWMGSALFDPGERPRLQVLRQRAREAVQIVLGAVPLFVLIGLVEGFVSPGPWLPGWVKLSLGLALLAALWLHVFFRGSPGAALAEPAQDTNDDVTM